MAHSLLNFPGCDERGTSIASHGAYDPAAQGKRAGGNGDTAPLAGVRGVCVVLDCVRRLGLHSFGPSVPPYDFCRALRPPTPMGAFAPHPKRRRPFFFGCCARYSVHRGAQAKMPTEFWAPQMYRRGSKRPGAWLAGVGGAVLASDASRSADWPGGEGSAFSARTARPRPETRGIRVPVHGPWSLRAIHHGFGCTPL